MTQRALPVPALLPLNSRNGSVTIADAESHAPFKICDCVLVTTPDVGRAQRATMRFLICLSGEIEIAVDTTKSTKTFRLTDLTQGVLIPPDVWCSESFKKPGTTMLMLTDRPFAERDAMRDRAKFGSYMESKRKVLDRRPIRLNLGCGGRPMPGWINVDMDSLDEIRARYPNRTYDESLVVVDYNIFNLPFDDNSVAEIRSEGLIEHLPFIDEPRFFNESVRVLAPGGLLYLATVDFEQAVKEWLAAPDEWKDFFRDDEEAIRTEHWFGTFSYQAKNRWGYQMATMYGSQKGAGQFHTNAYSEGKFHAMCERLKLDVEAIERFRWQGDRDPIIALSARKPK